MAWVTQHKEARGGEAASPGISFLTSSSYSFRQRCVFFIWNFSKLGLRISAQDTAVLALEVKLMHVNSGASCCPVLLAPAFHCSCGAMGTQRWPATVSASAPASRLPRRAGVHRGGAEQPRAKPGFHLQLVSQSCSMPYYSFPLDLLSRFLPASPFQASPRSPCPPPPPPAVSTGPHGFPPKRLPELSPELSPAWCLPQHSRSITPACCCSPRSIPPPLSTSP